MNDTPEPAEPTPLRDLLDAPADFSELTDEIVEDDAPEKHKRKRKRKSYSPFLRWLTLIFLFVPIVVLLAALLVLSQRDVSRLGEDSLRLTMLADQGQIAALQTAVAVTGGVSLTPQPTFTAVPFRVSSSLGKELDTPGPVPSQTGAVPITSADSLDENGCVGHPTTTFSRSTPVYIVIESQLQMGQTLDIRLYKSDGITEVLRTPLLLVDRDYAHVCASFKFESTPLTLLEKGTYIANVSLSSGFFLGSTAFIMQ